MGSFFHVALWLSPLPRFPCVSLPLLPARHHCPLCVLLPSRALAEQRPINIHGHPRTPLWDRKGKLQAHPGYSSPVLLSSPASLSLGQTTAYPTGQYSGMPLTSSLITGNSYNAGTLYSLRFACSTQTASYCYHS